MTFETFIVRHKTTIIAAIAGIAAGVLAALAVCAAILFGYYQIEPQEIAHITITQTKIQGTTEDGSEIHGFIITTEDGNQYLVTDYWNPIMLSNEAPSDGQ